MKKREAKGKREKGRYTHLNPEFQRIAVRKKKSFLSDQCKEFKAMTLLIISNFYVNKIKCYQKKEIEENNRIGKTRYLFKKIRASKGTFHAKMGTIKD